MALLNKLFSSKKKLDEGFSNSSIQTKVNSSTSSKTNVFPFCGSQVRVLLFRECEWTGRRILFDSNTITKISVNKENNKTNTTKNVTDENEKSHYNNLIDIVNGYAYCYGENASDINSIGEMIYGSIAMTNRGTSLKVHWLSDPMRIMCSQVFSSPLGHLRGNYSREVLAKTDVQGSLQRDTSNSMDVPTDNSNASMYLNSTCDSGYGNDVWSRTASNVSYCSQSTGTSMLSTISNDEQNKSSRKFSADSASILSDIMNRNFSDGAMHRRILRNLSTSFENSFIANEFAKNRNTNLINNTKESSNNTLGFTSTQRRHSDHTHSNAEKIVSREYLSPSTSRSTTNSIQKSKQNSRRSRIGLAICITLTKSTEKEMQIFCSEHISLLESILCRARISAEYAYLNHKQFHNIMLHMWLSTVSCITDFFTAPRISKPIWLTLTALERSKKSKEIAKSFMTELCWLLTHADTKDTNFFISTLLTAILTNHLGWIETVCGDSNSTNQNVQSKYQRISNYHPYNALWAQLSDICGAIGSPKKSTKTIVCGAQPVIINKILNTLTYFIRCSEIKRIFATKDIRSDELEDMLSAKEKPTKITQENSTISNENDTNSGCLVRSKTISSHLANISCENLQNAADNECIDQNKINTNQMIIDCVDVLNALNVETALDAMTILDEKKIVSEKCDNRLEYCNTDALNEENLLYNSDGNGNHVKKSVNENVVFMLGENELLSGIKKQPNESKMQSDEKLNKKKPCTHKKHSGVKFNFERYPQIVTNYMRNKNLDIDGYDFLQKGIKLEQNSESTSGACSANLLPLIVPENPSEEEEEEECECCANTFRILQTPSNATELEFSSDDNTYPMPTTSSGNNNKSPNKLAKNVEKSQPNDDKKLMKIEKLMKSELKTLNLIYLPIPKTTILQDVLENKKISMDSSPGFVPSLFVGVSDHYIPDMVLQGTTANPKTWESHLKESNDLLSHYTSFDQLPTENFIILANVDEWNVKLISSQSHSAYRKHNSSTSVGMSQLVSTMLESVNAMWLAGISAYDCLNFMESKLKELYVHSEVLAEFLLSTEFCSLNTITSTLDICENDVPLLLSVASIHSPHVSKKYGISFR